MFYQSFFGTAALSLFVPFIDWPRVDPLAARRDHRRRRPDRHARPLPVPARVPARERVGDHAVHLHAADLGDADRLGRVRLVPGLAGRCSAWRSSPAAACSSRCTSAARRARRPSPHRPQSTDTTQRNRTGASAWRTHASASSALGLMGHGMAKNLVTKGFPLTVRVHRNRKPLEDLLAAGAKEVSSNADVARNADIVFLCVTGAPQVEEIVFGADGLMTRRARRASIVVDTSTSRARHDGEDARGAGARRASRSSTRRSRARRSRRSRVGSTSWSAPTTRCSRSSSRCSPRSPRTSSTPARRATGSC